MRASSRELACRSAEAQDRRTQQAAHEPKEQAPSDLPPELVRDLRRLLKEILVSDYRENNGRNPGEG